MKWKKKKITRLIERASEPKEMRKKEKKKGIAALIDRTLFINVHLSR